MPTRIAAEGISKTYFRAEQLLYNLAVALETQLLRYNYGTNLPKQVCQ
jgi:hypothetical protein